MEGGDGLLHLVKHTVQAEPGFDMSSCCLLMLIIVQARENICLVCILGALLLSTSGNSWHWGCLLNPVYYQNEHFRAVDTTRRKGKEGVSQVKLFNWM